MVDLDELHRERARFDRLPRLDLHKVGAADVVLFKLALDDAERQPRAVNGHVELLEKIGHRADVVLVPVCDEKSAQLVLVGLDIGHIGDDQIDPEHVVLREGQPAVDDDHVRPVLEYRDVLSDAVDAAERDHAQLFGFFVWHRNLYILSVVKYKAIILLCTIFSTLSRGNRAHTFFRVLMVDRFREK